jgi:hypothetical protein
MRQALGVSRRDAPVDFESRGVKAGLGLEAGRATDDA